MSSLRQLHYQGYKSRHDPVNKASPYFCWWIPQLGVGGIMQGIVQDTLHLSCSLSPSIRCIDRLEHERQVIVPLEVPVPAPFSASDQYPIGRRYPQSDLGASTLTNWVELPIAPTPSLFTMVYTRTIRTKRHSVGGVGCPRTWHHL